MNDATQMNQQNDTESSVSSGEKRHLKTSTLQHGIQESGENVINVASKLRQSCTHRIIILLSRWHNSDKKKTLRWLQTESACEHESTENKQ